MQKQGRDFDRLAQVANDIRVDVFDVILVSSSRFLALKRYVIEKTLSGGEIILTVVPQGKRQKVFVKNKDSIIGMHVFAIAESTKRETFASKLSDSLTDEQVEEIQNQLLEIAEELPTDAYDNEKNREVDELLKIKGDLDLFHDEDVAYASVKYPDRIETYEIEKKQFKEFLAVKFYRAEGK